MISDIEIIYKYLLTIQWNFAFACCVLHNHIVMSYIRDEMLEDIWMVPPNAPGTDPELRKTRDVRIVPMWTKDTCPISWDLITSQTMRYILLEEDQQQ